ncbi:Oligopeptide transporter [Wickerhamomyces ciferrii]|uniref:Oligopeptide transporter n=1 Tax=Wickerhamomyces ciferrii (strain ATCC 14091 / BCRC 22168 / CBS 111 / JCM 3599 / NBRC 0793 / NRRL Y-1031 F-60-10) TaxID=1206466 RepID=K0KSN2_WICCF|nr:Oligopeptide transporter [Wickerhamomyces ciferrii]CCH44333.1 Oligopeptide transporter [Wickerhamomyces ciferrii]
MMKRHISSSSSKDDVIELNQVFSNTKTEKQSTFDIEPLGEIGEVFEDFDVNEILDEDADDSPIPEVRAIVSKTDDPNLPVNTLRMWVLGIISTIIGSGVNQFFSMRYPSVTISALVCQLVVYPIGQFLASILPLKTINLGKYLGEFTINPDRKFNYKEHAMITIMANISFTSSYATDVIQAQVAFYGIEAKPAYQVLLVLTCQLFGLGVAGLFDNFLVKPSAIYWPTTLANVALFKSIHSKENKLANGWKITRLRFFMIVFLSSFAYYWLPGYIFTGLSYFTFICWAAPNNVVVNQLFGQVQGLGFFPLTFDWAQIAYNGSPLVTPLYAQLNALVGVAFFIMFLTPLLYYKNAFFSAYLPISSSNVFDNMGNEYNGTRIIDSNGRLDLEAYQNYSPPYLAVAYAIAYGSSYAVLTCGPIYAILYHGKDIYNGFKGRLKKDIHVRLMDEYPSVPKWWYVLLSVVVFGITCTIMEVYHTQWPIWGIFLAFVLVILFILPIGLVYGATNINTNNMTVLVQLLSGYLLPGLPIVSLTFKFYAYTGVLQALSFSSDMKLGYYMKIPKRTIFFGQLIACTIGALVQVGVLIFMLNNVEGICTSDQVDNFTCPQGRVNFAASVVWGAAGPKRIFGPSTIYGGLLHLFWIGPVVTIITYCLMKKFPENKILKNLNWVVIFGCLGNFPPATGINYTTWVLVGVIFNYYIRKKYSQWWSKYLYVLSCGLDVGLALGGIIIFFALSYPGISLNWKGNTIYNDTADGLGTPYLKMPEKGYFGFDTWN